VSNEFRFCPACAAPLALQSQMEDGGEKARMRCTGCDYTHWNNPTPVLAAVVEYQGKILLARNAAWSGEKFALITGFMEAGETPEGGIAREIAEETNLQTSALKLLGVYDFQRMNQVIIAYHAVCHGEVRLSPELVDYRLYAFEDVLCWPAGTGYALADFLTSRGHEPTFVEWSTRDFQAFAKQTGNELVEQQTAGSDFIHVLKRR
jgi:NADH pyrophosphatase NudC (nudix superfamily)